MLDISLDIVDPAKFSSYFKLILVILVLHILFAFISKIFKLSKPKEDLDVHKIFPYDEELPMRFYNRIKKLKETYVRAFIIVRSAKWIKTPYLCYLFMTFHKFSFIEIGQLYLISVISNFVFNPLITLLADKYGRKFLLKFSIVSNMVIIFLQIKGSHSLAYLAQILAGFASDIDYLFEAWIKTEIDFITGGQIKMPERIENNIIKSSMVWDSFVYIIISFIGILIYSYFGIFALFKISIALYLLSLIYIQISWNENINMLEYDSFLTLKQAIKEIKSVNVLFIGLMEGIVIACFNIFLFIWTPILKETAKGEINIGYVYLIMILVGSLDFHFSNICSNCGNYLSNTIYLLFQGLFLFLTYYINNFVYRMIFLALFYESIKVYHSVKNSIKSKIKDEKSLIYVIKLFEIPTIIYLVIIVIYLKCTNPLELAFVAGIMSFVAFGFSLLLVIINLLHKEVDIKKDDEKKTLKKNE